MKQISRPRRKIFETATKAGQPVRIGGRTIIPFATSYQLRNPFWEGAGVIYNRPTSVYVANADGQEQVIPVHDVTRLALLALWGSVLAAFILVILLGRQGRT